MSKTTVKICVAVCAAFIFCALCWFFIKRQPPVWTSQNSLIAVNPPTVADDLSAESLKTALRASLRYFSKQRPDKSYDFGPDRISIDLMKDSIETVLERLNKDGLSEQFYDFLRTDFRFYRSAADSVLFTGYYEATLRGSLNHHDQYKYPLYGRPDDLYPIDLRQFFSESVPEMPRSPRARLTEQRTIVPYYSRAEIDYDQKLAGKNLELVWTDSAIDNFFLHIQGSGRVILDNGKVVRVNYADTNGQAYKAIGRYLKDAKLINDGPITTQAIKAFLKNNPDKQQEVLSVNPSYIFFKLATEGPFGSTGAILTPDRSIATDNAIFPPGALALIETEKPVFAADGSIERWQKFTRLVLNQDTGGAIRGAGRVDVFSGSGPQAEATAGVMQQRGQLTFLIKQP